VTPPKQQINLTKESPDESCGLFLFTRFPVPGHTKTRLIPRLGDIGAANLQKQMTEHLVNRLQEIPNLTLQIHFTGTARSQMQAWLGDQVTFICQSEGDLGHRLQTALHQGFTTGLQRIIIIGSDCPALDESHITQAFSLLRAHDVVIGPATDGGYYLIGLNQVHSALFEDIPWGSDRVFSLTKAIAQQQNLSVALLTPLSDIDRPEDLPLWDKVTGKQAT